MIQKLRRLFRARLAEIPAADWLLFFQAWAWLFIFDLALRTRPFRQVQALASGPLAKHPGDLEQAAGRCLLAVDRARQYHLYPMTCLRRALTLQKLLARQGVLATLKIGVRKSGEQLLAHAWIEAGGQVIGEREPVEARYQKIFGKEGSETHGSA